MALDSYANLKQAIIDHLDRDDLTGFVDDFIDIAEARFRDEVRFREILERSTITLADGDRTEALPADFAAAKSLRFLNPDTSQYRRFLPRMTQLSEEELSDVTTNDEGPPKYFAIEKEIEFDKEADQDYTGDLLYYKVMTPLSGAATSNELLVRAPDIYLYGSLAASAPFLMNDERINTWEGLYRAGRDRVNQSTRTDARPGRQVSQVRGV